MRKLLKNKFARKLSKGKREKNFSEAIFQEELRLKISSGDFSEKGCEKKKIYFRKFFEKKQKKKILWVIF